jgi:2-keto-3-deoxy-L-rhamnonate aldolase RhmA
LFEFDKPTLKTRLKKGEALSAFWFSLGSIPLIEAAVSAGAEAVIIDMQHGLFDRAGLETAIGVVPADIPCLVRVEDDTPAAIGRALDAGAEGVIVPLVETVAQAKAVAAACHYPPKGRRSGGGVRPLADFAAYIAAADAAITVGVMIETKKGIENAEAIAGTAGIDFVFIGTGDLALSIGAELGSKAHDRACAKILKASGKAKKPCGIFSLNAESAVERAGQGYWLTIAANDISAMQGAFNEAAEALKKGRADRSCSGRS